MDDLASPLPLPPPQVRATDPEQTAMSKRILLVTFGSLPACFMSGSLTASHREDFFVVAVTQLACPGWVPPPSRTICGEAWMRWKERRAVGASSA
jgi:hypothetical protein